jgi:diaminopimelate epimerase
LTIAITHTGHVNHNRFVLLDLRKSRFLSDTMLGAISQKLCAETACDDLIVIDRSQKANARMRVFGADAREADFCGNGSLLTLDILFSEQREALKFGSQVTLETRVGTITGFYKNGYVQYVQYGNVTNADNAIPDLNIDPDALQMARAWQTRVVGFRIAGEPHLILMRDAPSDNPLRDQAQFELLAENIFNSVTYDGGVNITIIMNHIHDTVEVMTFERGVRRLTQSCGSGSVAVASVLSDQSRSMRLLTIDSPGGQHRVEVREAGGTILLSGDVVRHTRTRSIAGSFLANNFPRW